MSNPFHDLFQFLQSSTLHGRLMAGAAVAMLIAGPAINLPSLFTIARSTNWKVAGSVALTIFVLAVAGGLLVSLF